MSNSVDHDEPSHQDLRCLLNPIIVVYGSGRVMVSKFRKKNKHCNTETEYFWMHICALPELSLFTLKDGVGQGSNDTVESAIGK